MWKLEFVILILNLLTINPIEGCSSKKCKKYHYQQFTDLSKFITNLGGGRKLNNLALVETQDSVTYNIAEHRTQEMDLSDQLVNGIRVWELGLRVESNKLKIHTILHDLKMTLERAIEIMRAFLKKNPGEIGFAFIYSVNSPETYFCPTLDGYLRANDDLLVKDWSLNDTIEMHRGKMLLGTIGDRIFSQCVKNLEPECRLSSQGRISIFGERQIQAKQRELRRLQEASFFEDYQCFISFLSGDYMDSSYEMAVKGTKQCDEPINHFMANYFDNSHRGLIILKTAFPTADLINQVYHSNVIRQRP